MLAQLLHAQRDQVARKQFCQRRCDRFEQAAAAHDVEIFVHREAGRGKDSGSGANLLCVQSGRFRQFQPALDSTFVLVVASPS